MSKIISQAVTTVTAIAFVAVAALAVTACSKDSKSGASSGQAASVDKNKLRGSCDMRKTLSTCVEETEKSDELDMAKDLCKALEGTWNPGVTCATDHVVGACADKDGSTTRYYSNGGSARDADGAKSSCEQVNEGRFTLASK